MSTPTRLVGLAGFVAGRVPVRFSDAFLVSGVVDDRRDHRFMPAAVGTLAANNRVLVKPTPEAPAQPMPGALVRLHALRSGRCAWAGVSDAQGYYHPTKLEVGERYIPVAIDLTGTHECVAAGPVVAVEPPT